MTESVDGEDTEDHYSPQSTSVCWCLQRGFVGVQEKEPRIWNTVGRWMQLCGCDEQEAVCLSVSTEKRRHFLEGNKSQFYVTQCTRFIPFSDYSNMYSCPHWQSYTEPEAETAHKCQRRYLDLRCEKSTVKGRVGLYASATLNKLEKAFYKMIFHPDTVQPTAGEYLCHVQIYLL